jgi:cytochrome o ubiquinol oxidase subunit 3
MMIKTDNLPIYSDSKELAHTDNEEIRTFGFWIYLMSDIILFSVLFAAYAVLGSNYADGPTPKELFSLPYVFVETMFLLLSNASCSSVLPAAEASKKIKVLSWLVVTFLLGAGFITMEINEFYRMIMENYGPERSGFLSSFFTLVGTHGFHVVSGLVWIGVMIGQVMTKGITVPVRSRLMRLSMFWHFLDIVWVGVFTLVYLMGVL